MDNYRFKTKMDVNQRQTVFFPAMNRQPAGYYPACALCGGKNPTDLHEVWISRADVAGNADLIQKVTTAVVNTVALHNHPCHIPYAEKQRIRFQMILVDIYGKDKIITWINSLGLKAPEPYVNMVLAVPAK